MIIKIIAALVIISITIYLIYKSTILEDRNNHLLLELRIKDSHIKQQQEKIEKILKEAEDIREELNAIY
jgi:peptidoglycan hydrolase CwlO-like protein